MGLSDLDEQLWHLWSKLFTTEENACSLLRLNSSTDHGNNLAVMRACNSHTRFSGWTLSFIHSPKFVEHILGTRRNRGNPCPHRPPILLVGEGRLGETENKPINKQVLLIVMTQVIRGGGCRVIRMGP